MRIDIDKFLSMTALIAVAGAGACTVKEDKDAPSGTGGTSASGGSSSSGGAASGGRNSSGGVAATGGADAGSDSGGSDSGADAADSATPDGDASVTPCLGDTVPALPEAGIDAGAEGVDPCFVVAGGDWCQPDAGGEGYYSAAYDLCSALQFQARPGVLAAIVECLGEGAPLTPCDPAAGQRARACFDAAAARACERPSGDGGTNPCTAFSAACPQITEARCSEVLRAFSEESLGFSSICLADAVADLQTDAGAEGLTCDDWFRTCAVALPAP